MIPLGVLHQRVSERFRPLFERPRREAELLLRGYFGYDQLYFITHAETMVDEEDSVLVEWIERRARHYPLEYLTHRVSFYSQEFYIDERALIPRPETEILIDHALAVMDPSRPCRIVEVGVGSGIISILLAQHLPLARIDAVDIDLNTLALAQINIDRLGLSDRIHLHHSDLLNAIEGEIDCLISNPPYIANDAVLEPNLAYEPQKALFGGERGDEIVFKLIKTVFEREIPLCICEIGYDQRAPIEEYLKNFTIQSVVFYHDLAYLDRGFVLRTHYHARNDPKTVYTS